ALGNARASDLCRGRHVQPASNSWRAAAGFRLRASDVNVPDAGGRWPSYRWKSSLSMKGEVVTHQLDCAVACLTASGFTPPSFVAAIRASCSIWALRPSVSQMTRYLVK